jgi:hypothetical protein
VQRSEITASVETLLKELHEKKRWLDMMIGGLEAAVSSPEHQLIASLEEVFHNASARAARSDLQRERRAALASLARSVNATPHARRKRSLSLGQAAST